MNKGFGRNSSRRPVFKASPLTDAAEIILGFAQRAGKPVILAMHPPGNDHGLNPGEMQGSEVTEVRPSCQGVLICVSASPEDTQKLVDLVMQWKVEIESGGDRP